MQDESDEWRLQFSNLFCIIMIIFQSCDALLTTRQDLECNEMLSIFASLFSKSCLFASNKLLAQLIFECREIDLQLNLWQDSRITPYIYIFLNLFN